jgi:bifunctional non-homologous end joining protein LigD
VIKTKFIEPMLLLPAEELPEGPEWIYELKLDGFRALAIKTGGEVRLRSRNDKNFNQKYPGIARALAALPDETVIDGEVVALDAAGRPSFNALQNGAVGAAIIYYVFDVMILAGRDVVGETLARRRDLLSREVLPRLADPVREAPRFDASLSDLIAAIRAQGLEGLVAKRLDSVYEPGARSGAWRKDAAQPVGGVRDRRLHQGREDIRRDRHRPLGRGSAGLCREDTGRVHSGEPGAADGKAAASGDRQVSVCESPGGPERPVGRGTHGGEDEGVRVGAAGVGRGGGVRGIGRRTVTCGMRGSLA